MAISLKHAFTSAKADSADATLIQPSNWNAEHTLTLGTGKLVGRTTAGTGAAEEISVGSGLSLSGGVLDTVEAQNLFKTISVAGQSDIVADSTTDTLTVAAGSGITLTTNASTDTLTIAVTGSTYQPLDATLTSLAGLGTAADKFAYTTGVDTWAEGAITSFGRSLIDDSDASAARTTLGLGTMATETASNYLTTSSASSTYQPLDSDLTSWAGVTRASGFDTFTATPSSANLASLVTDETGSGKLVFATSPTLTTPTLGAATASSVAFTGSTSGTVTLQPAAAAGTYTLTLPTNDGDAGQFLKTDGSGVLSWDTVSASPGGSNTQLQYNSSGSFAGASGITTDGTDLSLGSSSTLKFSTDLILGRKAAANLRLGAADAASPVAQTISTQNVVAGTSNTAGVNLTINGSQGTGTGAGGSIVFQVAPAGSTGTAQNSLVTFLEATSTRSFNLYNTTDVTTNYERGFMRWSSNELRIGSEAAGTATTRDLGIYRGATRIISVATDYVSFATTDFGFQGKTIFRSPSDGVLNITAWSATSFTRLNLGPATSSFPALKRSSATLQVRLADDSGYTTLDANHRLQGTAPAANNSTGTAGDIRYDADYIYICTATDTWKRVAIATW